MSLSILSSKALALQEPIIKEYSIMFISKACKKPLEGNEDIFLCRDFCSEECRQEQLDIDESKDKSKSLTSSMKASSIGDVNSWIRIKRYASNILPKEILERSSLQQLYLLIVLPSRSSLSPVY
ncbi:hypothetical protein V6N13_014838 [Hibiscus sabdariffa]